MDIIYIFTFNSSKLSNLDLIYSIAIDINIGCAPFSRNPIQFSNIKINNPFEKVAKLYKIIVRKPNPIFNF
ncbi:MAG: hypothetical protein ACJAX4_001330 [Clostridium sp.]|jgi:hypothetical protein